MEFEHSCDNIMYESVFLYVNAAESRKTQYLKGNNMKCVSLMK